jgi:hypothetical protein
MKPMLIAMMMLMTLVTGCTAANVSPTVEVEASDAGAPTKARKDAGTPAVVTPKPVSDAGHPIPDVEAGNPIPIDEDASADDAATPLPAATAGVVSCLVTPADGGTPQIYHCDGTGNTKAGPLAGIGFVLANTVGGPNYQGAYEGDAGSDVYCFPQYGTPPPCERDSRCTVELGGNEILQGVCL